MSEAEPKPAMRENDTPALRELQYGRWGYVLAWLIGVPVPILVLIYLLRGCT